MRPSWVRSASGARKSPSGTSTTRAADSETSEASSATSESAEGDDGAEQAQRAESGAAWARASSRTWDASWRRWTWGSFLPFR